MQISEYLEAVREGKQGAGDLLYAAVYDALRRVAQTRLSHEQFPTLHPTELVHEAWIRLGGDIATPWENRRHFFGAFAEAMRRTLVDRARAKLRDKRGGGRGERVSLTGVDPEASGLSGSILDLNEALEAFEKVEPMKAQVVKLKFFAGMSIKEIAEVTDLSAATVERYWAYSRAWLYHYIARSHD
ncbi:ECF-type sigma factor [Blastopirellula retiformator]|uniref:ECF sigma factor n=1 Tax=Blastopirellula retiformator TaxID=2527970 RepID=A0A5C5V0N3_9BACT|nr:ECF-type sigma factor [Blastopirellula retiformator]TWT31569.1 ECF sigma factor [Blastopirellula retiformator]